MSTEFVTVGCRLPAGLTIEVGYTASVKAQGRGAPFARYTKGTDYASFTLKGTNAALLVRDPSTRKIVTTLPARRNAQPYINQVPKEIWDRWCKEHPNSWYLTTGQLFVVAKNDPVEIEATAVDATQKQAPIFQPMDPSAVVDLDNVRIEKRTDD